MFDHTNLQIWRCSHELSIRIDRSLKGQSRKGPPGLASQLSRACASIPANIAEGAGQASPLQTLRFLDIALGSATETQNHLERAGEVGLLPKGQAHAYIEDIRSVRRMTLSFRRWVMTKIQDEDK